MKYQYNLENSQPESKFKTFLIRGFLFCCLFGIVYEGYKFFQSLSGNAPRGIDRYCGNHTCYEMLNLERTASQDQIKKSYRILARQYHPDKSKQQNALQIFQTLNKAYQILLDQKQRFIYDLYLNNPDQSQYRRQFQYYNHKYIQNPQIPVSAVIIGVITCISALQYVIRKQMYEKAIERISESHDFRIKVNQRCNGNKRIKQDVKEQMIKQIEIQGGLARPTYQDIFAYKVVLSPWRILIWFKNWIKWITFYYILRRPYDLQAQQYLTKKALSISKTQWTNLAQQQKTKLIKRQLWIQGNKQKFQIQKRKQWLQQLRNNNPGRYNMVLKYMKQNNIKIQ